MDNVVHYSWSLPSYVYGRAPMHSRTSSFCSKPWFHLSERWSDVTCRDCYDRWEAGNRISAEEQAFQEEIGKVTHCYNFEPDDDDDDRYDDYGIKCDTHYWNKATADRSQVTCPKCLDALKKPDGSPVVPPLEGEGDG